MEIGTHPVEEPEPNFVTKKLGARNHIASVDTVHVVSSCESRTRSEAYIKRLSAIPENRTASSIVGDRAANILYRAVMQIVVT